MKEAIDSYALFIDKFEIVKEDMYQFGIENTILPDAQSIDKNWKELKNRVFNNKTVYIRGAGRDAKGTRIYQDFYIYLFNNENIMKDPTNNQVPQKAIENLTGYKRNVSIFNFQVSHIFGRTKNPLLFEAPWNIAFIPKLIDPFTGHESKGPWPLEYQSLFIGYIMNRHKQWIEDYNMIIDSLNITQRIDSFINNLGSKEYTSKEIKNFKIGVQRDLSRIELI